MILLFDSHAVVVVIIIYSIIFVIIFTIACVNYDVAVRVINAVVIHIIFDHVVCINSCCCCYYC